jgi:CRP/FNR family transcriptional regulator, cyclic AMP receptor protein
VIGTAEKVLFLKGVPLFAAISGEDLAEIALIAEEVRADGGDVLMREGEYGDAMYLVADGRVRVRAGEREVATLGAREIFGEMALLDPGPRSATVEAVDDVTLLRIGRDDLADLMAERPEVPAGLIKVLARRLREAIKTVG